MEKKELVETNEAIPSAIGEVEEDSFTLQSEEDWDKHSVGLETQNVDRDSPEFGSDQDDVLGNVTSQTVENLEGDGFTIQSEDHEREPKEVNIQSIGHDGPVVDIEPEIMSEKIDEVIDVQLSSHEETTDNVTGESELAQRKRVDDSCDLDNVTGESQLAHRVDDSSDLLYRSQEENLEASTVPGDFFQNEHETDSMKSETEVNVDGREYSGVEVDSSGDYEPKSQEVSVDSNFEHHGSDTSESMHMNQKTENTSEPNNLEPVVGGSPGDLFQNEHESDSMKCETEINIDGLECSGVKVDSGGDFEPKSKEAILDSNLGHHGSAIEEDDNKSLESTQTNQKTGNTSKDSKLEPVVGGSEVPATDVGYSTSIHTSDTSPEAPGVVEKAISLRDFVREKSIIAVSTMLRHLSGRKDEYAVSNSDEVGKDASNLSRDSETKDVTKEEPITEAPPLPIAMKGTVIVYTRLGCQECREVRKFLYMKRLRYVEINIDVYPSRKMELEKNSGSTSVPKVFFNAILIGGMGMLKSLNESGELNEKIDYLINETPSLECPLPPFSGEDDVSTKGALDEMALIVRKMKECIVVKDRFCKLRRFANCFLGSEAVDFLSADQYLERKEAVVFGRKLASKLFFQHVLEENLFEDGNHLYRFLDDEPNVASMCYNVTRGISTVKPKPMTEVASRLRLLSYAMFEAYASEDGRHVDYRSMHGSEEFARYLRIVEELQRGEVWDLSREEKLAFFINLYNMMAIHAILVWGHPSGTLERRKLFVDFKYVIGGSTYSLSAIQNGILRVNQRPPYTLMKPFSAKDKRLRVALPFPEPLIHFALVYGTRSGPALRCYSPGDIDKELVDAASNFLRSGGLLIDFTAKVAYASKILKWFSVDFGKYEVEVLKHVSNYLDRADSELLLDLLAISDLKVIYQPYGWGLNC